MSTSMAEALREYDNNVVIKLCWEQSLNEAGNPLRNPLINPNGLSITNTHNVTRNQLVCFQSDYNYLFVSE